MIVLWNSAGFTCQLLLLEGETIVSDTYWDAGHELAKQMLGYLQSTLRTHSKDWDDITGIGVYRGPGSFTGLRIGLTVLNTLAHSKNIPIVGATGDAWQATCRKRLASGENDGIVLPEYGSEARVTSPRK
ncbi:hypothetical protein L336_0322 [Candidatus Saccharimonas aalborgensis]|uniref:Gcp-like domain-containing protein n=1 Tax=Candidatus Saccharimonas aalborgensis TaxID=1332188 RepID=R4PV16_9BACT|nr:tRNA (adenosine(37)-N6)-threonylcarbamoyltransferase complex dimerization subunit type 1 TsaB [Candidatus Saccharimonas aalborgensis]AGL62030.1 hypothetical protein L336_0322 [Candidatus Saccharimonas aalborgensis]MBP7775036.1 tRNA (adenosine(37)-N6)-threonylcarbamoyltransferase complex dimerization subunit type 1 TsaB [Candidatus Saccharimonas sp.]QQR50805.1 MAG: tRNA (adenosine(37)-N6)-threonylcarbamoyltransferase complex dimerization subunit type 1 TsaB [Candidatus Saccharibacteria bacteri